jgi:hypothetical protein
MAQDPERAFEIKNGIIIDSSAGVFSGQDSPVGLLNPLPGSIYMRTNGEIWYKWGTDINEWLSGLQKSEVIIDDDFLINGEDIIRIQTSVKPITVTLPEISTTYDKRTIIIKDIDGQARLNEVTLIPSGLDTVDNNTSITIRVNNFSLSLIVNTSNKWEII